MFSLDFEVNRSKVKATVTINILIYTKPIPDDN